VFADSGKKQIIFRAPVNYDRSSYVVQMEDEQLLVQLPEFKDVMELATIVSAAIGKKALCGPMGFGCYMQFMDLFGEHETLEKWIEIQNSPMGKIASWACKGKDDARSEDFVSARIQETTSRGDRSQEAKPKPGKTGKSKAGSNQLGFNFA
jgi:hypothetical protein